MLIAEKKEKINFYEPDINEIKSYLVIENSGEIAIEALELLGASTKDGVNSIGQFGSGNKYALAYFIRNNIDLTILSGEKTIKITCAKAQLREKEFKRIIIGDKSTSITDSLGEKDWELWMAMREIISNSIDEPDFKIYTTNKIQHEKNKTRFVFIMQQEIIEYLLTINTYFSYSRTPFIELLNVVEGPCAIYKKIEPGPVKIYKKGILVYKGGKSLYDYEFSDVTINESRIVKDTNNIESSILSTVFSKLYHLLDNASPEEKEKLLKKLLEYIDSIISVYKAGFIESISIRSISTYNLHYIDFYINERYFLSELDEKEYGAYLKQNKNLKIVSDNIYKYAIIKERTIFDMNKELKEFSFTDRELLMLKKINEILLEIKHTVPLFKKMDSRYSVHFAGDPKSQTVYLYSKDFEDLMKLLKTILKRTANIKSEDEPEIWIKKYLNLLLEKHCIII